MTPSSDVTGWLKTTPNPGRSGAAGVVPRCLVDNQVIKKLCSGSGVLVGLNSNAYRRLLFNDVLGKAVEARLSFEMALER